VDDRSSYHSHLQETRLSLNGFAPSAPDDQNELNGRKRSYQASQLSLQAPSCFPLGENNYEPKKKVDKCTSNVDSNLFASALMAAEIETAKPIVEIQFLIKFHRLLAHRALSIALNIENDLKEIIDIYFRQFFMDDKSHSELAKQFPKLDVPALHVPDLDKCLILIQGKQSLKSIFVGNKTST
jgi:hypothetical protein